MDCAIYKITNTANGGVYIGKTIHPDKRKGQHFAELRTGKHHNAHLQNSYNKYGEDAFTWEVIEQCTEEAMNDLEVHHIANVRDTHALVYNMRDGGIGGAMSEEARQKIGLAQVGRKRTEETKQRISIALLSRLPKENVSCANPKCNNDVLLTHRNRDADNQYCSKKCHLDHRTLLSKTFVGAKQKFICVQCGMTFSGYNVRKFCSKKCCDVSKTAFKSCRACGTSFVPGKPSNECCSNLCAQRWRRNKSVQSVSVFNGCLDLDFAN